MRKVTIIILTWNGLSYTRKCLDSLFSNTEYDNFSVLVVDNGSSDGTIEYLKSRKDISYILNGENLGFVRGNNVALRKVKDGDVVLLNNDVIIEQKDWLSLLNKTAYEDEKNGVVGCRLVNENGTFLHAGTYIYPETFWGQQIGGGEENIGQYPFNRKVEGVVFACAYIKREVLDIIPGLNEKFFSYFEDTDYCLDVTRHGYKCVCCGKVTIIHCQNVSTAINQVNFNDMFLKSQKVFKSIWGNDLQNRYTRKMAWHSIVNFPSGYAESAKNFMLSLDSKNVDIRYKYVYGKGTPFRVMEPEHSDNYIINIIRSRRFEESIPQVVYGQGDVFFKNTGKYKIGYTMLETTGIPKEWVKQANEMNEVWVPSHFNVETFRNSGVKVPIYVIPLGIDINYYNPYINAQINPDYYTFLSVFEWGERKNPEMLLRAFSRAFTKKDNVRLICKIFNNDGTINVNEEIAKLNLPSDGPDIIFLYNQKIRDIEMPVLYRSADCFVLSTRGEGWGMPILEAMASGKPVIATNWSAQTEFFNEDVGYPIRVKKLIDAKAKCPYYEGFQWAEADEDQLIETMRYVYSHREEATAKGLHAFDVVKEKWTWDCATEKMVDRLKAIGN